MLLQHFLQLHSTIEPSKIYRDTLHFYRVSCDGVVWEKCEKVIRHPLLLAANEHCHYLKAFQVIFSWGFRLQVPYRLEPLELFRPYDGIGVDRGVSHGDGDFSCGAATLKS